MPNFAGSRWLGHERGPTLYPVEVTLRRVLVLTVLFVIPILAGSLILVLELAPFWQVVLGGVSLLAIYEILGFVALRFGLLLNPARVRRLTHAFAEEKGAKDSADHPSALPVAIAFKAFANFEPKPMHDPALGMIIDQFGCRVSGDLEEDASELYTIYLAGDCTFFDIHLRSEDAIIHHLEGHLNEREKGRRFRVVSAAFQHYVALHSLVRIAIHMNVMPIHCVVFACGINDVLAYLHTEGRLAYDFSNRYVSSDQARADAGDSWRWLLKHSLLARALYLRWGEVNWDRSVYLKLSERRYYNPAVFAAARQGFSTKLFEGHLSSIIGLCGHRGIPLILTTVKYRQADMVKDPRRFVAEGLNKLNDVIATMGERFGVPVVRFHELIPDDETFVFNKWHFTPKANELRASLLALEILRVLQKRNRKSVTLREERLGT